MATYTDLECAVCKKIFSRLLKSYTYELKRSGENYSPICSAECKKKFRSKIQSVSCDNCDILFEKQFAQIIKSKHNFCSQSCAATFNNKHRQTKPNDKEVNCKYCNIIFIVKRDSIKQVCDICRQIKKNSYYIASNCLTCGVKLFSKNGKKKYCDFCRHIFYQNLGSKIGKLSAAKQVRRSKNEIYFAELCQQLFNKISTNDPIFVSKYGNWDADVIIFDHKIAVLWNGIWHSQKVRKGHSVKQVQSRDKIKVDVIKDNGYIPYIITDLGKHNKIFVEEEFNKLKTYITNMAL
jgi:hypothetical protein